MPLLPFALFAGALAFLALDQESPPEEDPRLDLTQRPSRYGMSLPGASPAARQAQSFRASISSQPGSWTQRNSLNRGANIAYSRRMSGEDIGEEGFAMIRASRPRSVGGTAGHIAPAWGSPWRPEGGDLELGGDIDSIAESVASEFG